MMTPGTSSCRYPGVVGETRAKTGSDAHPSAMPPVHEAWLPSEHPLHRPRHSERQRTALVAALVFFLAPLLVVGFGVRPAEFENRQLAPFPSVTAGWQFFPRISAWAGDHLPVRDMAVRAVNSISQSLFDELYPFGQDSRQLSPATGPVTPPLDDTEQYRQRDELLRTGFPQVLEGRDGWFYLGYEVLGACLPERPPDEVFENLRMLREAIESSGRRFVLIPAPNKTTMVPQNLPENYVGAECAREATARFWNHISAQPGVVDLRPELNEAAARSTAPLYSPVDTHWTEEGGLIMTQELAEAVAPGSTRTWVANVDTAVPRIGDLPLFLGRTVEYNFASYRLAPDGSIETQRRVDSEFRQPLRLQRPSLTGTVPDRVGMIADSFTLFATPYLAASFEDLTLLHVDTAGTEPHIATRMLAEQQVVVFEISERSLISGISPILSPQFIDAVAQELRRNPIR